MRRYTGQGATAWAVVLVLLGFLLIGAGWRGAAASTFVPAQLAYALSGGVLGLALIGAGIAILRTQVARIVEADAHHSLEELTAQTAALVASLHGRDARRG